MGKSALFVEIDADVRKEYWTEIRKQPEHKSKSHTAQDREPSQLPWLMVRHS